MRLPHLFALILLALTAGPALAQPPAPQRLGRIDYADPNAWLCLPGRADACAVDLSVMSVNPRGNARLEEFRPARDPRVDCFYVYPTVSTDPGFYSDMTPGPEERRVVAAQFARFGAACRTFAPQYRQITLTALQAAMAQDGGAALIGENLNGRGRVTNGGGYADVLEAFRFYMANYNLGRPFVLIGHSQGAAHLTRLLAEEIEGTTAESQLVSAILLGGNVQVPRGQNFGATFAHIPLCRDSSQTGCVIAYSAFRDTVPPGKDALFGQSGGPDTITACVNPADLRRGTGQPDSVFSAGTFRWIADPMRPIGTPFVRVPGLVTTTCVSGAAGTYLQVHVNADPKDIRTDDIPGDLMTNGAPDPAWGLHLVDMNLSLGDLVDLVERQGRAWRPAR